MSTKIRVSHGFSGQMRSTGPKSSRRSIGLTRVNTNRTIYGNDESSINENWVPTNKIVFIIKKLADTISSLYISRKTLNILIADLDAMQQIVDIKNSKITSLGRMTSNFWNVWKNFKLKLDSALTSDDAPKILAFVKDQLNNAEITIRKCQNVADPSQHEYVYMKFNHIKLAESVDSLPEIMHDTKRIYTVIQKNLKTFFSQQTESSYVLKSLERSIKSMRSISTDDSLRDEIVNQFLAAQESLKKLIPEKHKTIRSNSVPNDPLKIEANKKKENNIPSSNPTSPPDNKLNIINKTNKQKKTKLRLPVYDNPSTGYNSITSRSLTSTTRSVTPPSFRSRRVRESRNFDNESRYGYDARSVVSNKSSMRKSTSNFAFSSQELNNSKPNPQNQQEQTADNQDPSRKLSHSQSTSLSKLTKKGLFNADQNIGTRVDRSQRWGLLTPEERMQQRKRRSHRKSVNNTTKDAENAIAHISSPVESTNANDNEQVSLTLNIKSVKDLSKPTATSPRTNDDLLQQKSPRFMSFASPEYDYNSSSSIDFFSPSTEIGNSASQSLKQENSIAIGSSKNTIPAPPPPQKPTPMVQPTANLVNDTNPSISKKNITPPQNIPTNTNPTTSTNRTQDSTHVHRRSNNTQRSSRRSSTNPTNVNNVTTSSHRSSRSNTNSSQRNTSLINNNSTHRNDTQNNPVKASPARSNIPINNNNNNTRTTPPNNANNASRAVAVAAKPATASKVVASKPATNNTEYEYYSSSYYYYDDDPPPKPTQPSKNPTPAPKK